MKEQIIAAIRTCFDPEIPVNIYDLGLVYGIEVDDAGVAVVTMTLTSPGCPVAGSLPGDVEQKVKSVPGITAARVDLVWEPAWDTSMMSEAARLELGI